MEYLRLFENHSDYESAESGLLKPNVSHCIQENDVHYNSLTDPYNKHAYVDLGLPSGTMWATMNVGANSVTDYGNYYAWMRGADTWEENHEWSQEQISSDTASEVWGGEWHTPTKTQFDELFNTNYVTRQWLTNAYDSNVNGIEFTSVSNGNTLFIPAAGYYFGSEAESLTSVNKTVGLWTSTFSDYDGNPYYVNGYQYDNNLRVVVGADNDRTGSNDGYSIRPVVG